MDFSIPPVLLPSHTQADFNRLRGTPPNRICFATVHANALKENTGQYAERTPYKFDLRFRQGVVSEFFLGTGIRMRESPYGFWTPLSAEQADVVRAWMAEQGTRVYLKDLFDCSIALGERTVDNRETELGELFTAAKYERLDGAIAELAKRSAETISAMKSFQNVKCLSCPPPRSGKDFDLPTTIALLVSRKTGIPFMELGAWQGEKGQLKDVAADKKWSELERVGFAPNSQLKRVDGAILILDDIYQSGTTLNFMRSKLTAQGIARASSLSLVKAARDTDNQ